MIFDENKKRNEELNEKLKGFDKENRNNQGLLAKYGVGIEKIEEKAEEMANYSPNNNEILLFNSENVNKIHRNSVPIANNEILVYFFYLINFSLICL